MTGGAARVDPSVMTVEAGVPCASVDVGGSVVSELAVATPADAINATPATTALIVRFVFIASPSRCVGAITLLRES
jgi:hypothetical protein